MPFLFLCLCLTLSLYSLWLGGKTELSLSLPSFLSLLPPLPSILCNVWLTFSENVLPAAKKHLNCLRDSRDLTYSDHGSKGTGVAGCQSDCIPPIPSDRLRRQGLVSIGVLKWPLAENLPPNSSHSSMMLSEVPTDLALCISLCTDNSSNALPEKGTLWITATLQSVKHTMRFPEQHWVTQTTPWST